MALSQIDPNMRQLNDEELVIAEKIKNFIENDDMAGLKDYTKNTFSFDLFDSFELAVENDIDKMLDVDELIYEKVLTEIHSMSKMVIYLFSDNTELLRKFCALTTSTGRNLLDTIVELTIEGVLKNEQYLAVLNFYQFKQYYDLCNNYIGPLNITVSKEICLKIQGAQKRTLLRMVHYMSPSCVAYQEQSNETTTETMNEQMEES